MKFDGLEREFVILGAQLRRIAGTFEMLAAELCRERESGTPRGNDGGDQVEKSGQPKKAGGPQTPLPF